MSTINDITPVPVELDVSTNDMPPLQHIWRVPCPKTAPPLCGHGHDIGTVGSYYGQAIPRLCQVCRRIADAELGV